MSTLDNMAEDFDRLETLLDDIKYYYLGNMHDIRFIGRTKKQKLQFLNKLEFRCIFILSKIKEIREKYVENED